jgi:TRAP-type C4-dicarboxylate transport system permease small subunit
MPDPSVPAPQRALIIPKHRHLKWAALDPLEAGLMILCGVCMAGFTLCVFLDVLTRELGVPWLWLQQVFIGIAAASRRHEHIYLAEITRRMRGRKRLAIETANRVIVLIIAGFMVWFGYRNAVLDWGAYRMPSLIPMTFYTGIVPISGVLVALFMVEQIINGWKHGFEGPEDDELLGEHPE